MQRLFLPLYHYYLTTKCFEIKIFTIVPSLCVLISKDALLARQCVLITGVAATTSTVIGGEEDGYL